jgi:hypothetical protein
LPPAGEYGIFFEEAMSEFTYACPVCGQHIKCDMSQSGSKMECPTCFQTILAPDVSPMHDPKFVIMGTKVGERPIPTAVTTSGTPTTPAPAKKSPVAAVVLVVFIFAAGAAVFMFGGKIFKSDGGQTSRTAPAKNHPPQKTQTPAPPPVVAPPADDTNWMLNLGAVTMPGSTAAGRVHGQNFNCDRAVLQGGMLTLRVGARGAPDFGMVINFSGVPAEALAGQTINVATNADKAAGVTLRWKEGDLSLRENFTNNYAMRLEFGQIADNRMPGKIYLCMPDGQKSYVAGTFNAEIRKPKPPKQK